MSNYPAGAQNHPNAPWNQPDPVSSYRVVVEELWNEDDESLGFQVILLEIGENGDMIDELDLWYNFEEDANDHSLEEVEETDFSDYDDAKFEFDNNVEFYKNDNNG